MLKREIKAGDRFSMLTVIEETPTRSSGRYFKCQCDCGNIKEVLLSHLTRAKTLSCGCYGASLKIKHGLWESREYSTWENMAQRCTNPKTRKYHLYGGKGITMCERWAKSFASFYEDMGPRPPGTSLDRIDPSKGYYKENCRWATVREQIANLSRFTALIKHNGVIKETEDWIKELGVNREVFKARILRGLGYKEALLIVTDIIVLEVDSKRKTIYRLDNFLQETGFDKEEVANLLDSDHDEAYCGLILRYLTGFSKWPEKYQISKTAN
jgi:hypothetical protein